MAQASLLSAMNSRSLASESKALVSGVILPADGRGEWRGGAGAVIDGKPRLAALDMNADAVLNRRRIRRLGSACAMRWGCSAKMGGRFGRTSREPASFAGMCV